MINVKAGNSVFTAKLFRKYKMAYAINIENKSSIRHGEVTSNLF